jgi:hypothetical protein
VKPIVLDTDVVSFLFKGDSRAKVYVPQLRNRQLEQWALLANWGAIRVAVHRRGAGLRPAMPPFMAASL